MLYGGNEDLKEISATSFQDDNNVSSSISAEQSPKNSGNSPVMSGIQVDSGDSPPADPQQPPVGLFSAYEAVNMGEGKT